MDETASGWTDYEASPEATLVVDARGVIRRTNGAALALLGYSRDELAGCPLDRLLPERFREGHGAHVARYFQRPYARHLPLASHLVALHRDGHELMLDISLFPLETREGISAIAVLRPHAPADAERALHERLDFEALITDVTARVVVAAPESIDGALLHALERLRTAVGADRAVFLEYSEDWATAIITHVAYGDGVPQIPEKIDVRGLFPWTDRHLQCGQTLFIPDVSALPAEAAVDRASWQQLSTAALLIVPVFPSTGFRHALVVDRALEPRVWPVNLEPRIRLLGEIMVDALVRNRNAAELARANEELSNLKDRLESENRYLRESELPKSSLEGMVATSAGMTRVVELVQRVAPTDSTVLLLGETGTGKELLARAIHRLSGRKDRLLVAVNCAALPASLIESELFGREKGAYTGALARQAGRFELADRSTLFLDEVGELPLELQTKLLRVLETGEFERLGSPRTLKVSVRIVAATNRDLPAAVAAGTFRKDLYYRLSVFPISIPPLRDRREDIPALAWAVANELGEKMGRRVEAIPMAVIERLQHHAWPGNVRELRNIVERALILGTGPTLDIPLPTDSAPEADSVTRHKLTLEEAERRHIRAALEATGGRIRGEGGAAEQLGLHEATLRSRMKRLGINRLPS